MTKFEPHNDKPRNEIMDMAEKAISDFKKRGCEAKVYFKFTCPDCGERCTFEEPNRLYEAGICYACGKENPIEKSGFSLVTELT